ncbi:MAG: hypothetical protein TR69_WS6001000393 [candidate division WS6 bacterium OLB20]|uniref:Uncharacterized protein n=1 Tax=candidate division WS6 bacterium OLB20 TaxID=1617426 RepID=A0A136LXK0_9BACT|nr:MAG: hypothetical protein TR69_WS6001000393 [candidate division WS6 bacterium OLB20]
MEAGERLTLYRSEQATLVDRNEALFNVAWDAYTHDKSAGREHPVNRLSWGNGLHTWNKLPTRLAGVEHGDNLEAVRLIYHPNGDMPIPYVVGVRSTTYDGVAGYMVPVDDNPHKFRFEEGPAHGFVCPETPNSQGFTYLTVYRFQETALSHADMRGAPVETIVVPRRRPLPQGSGYPEFLYGHYLAQGAGQAVITDLKLYQVLGNLLGVMHPKSTSRGYIKINR